MEAWRVEAEGFADVVSFCFVVLSLKARTAELVGSEGRDEGISPATAVSTLASESEEIFVTLRGIGEAAIVFLPDVKLLNHCRLGRLCLPPPLALQRCRTLRASGKRSSAPNHAKRPAIPAPTGETEGNPR
jgi:hypothetical protein